MKRRCAVCMLWAMAAGAAPAAEVYNYWIQPCTEDVAARSGCVAADAELAHWALEAWEKVAGRGLRFVAADGEYTARIRVYWLGKRPQLYGDTRLVFVNGKRGAAIEVHPDLAQYGPQIAAAGRERQTVPRYSRLSDVPARDRARDWLAITPPISPTSCTASSTAAIYSNISTAIGEYVAGADDIRAHTGISEADRQRVAGLYAGR